MDKKYFTKPIVIMATLAGTTLEYYDYMLFTLMLPMIAPLFSNSSDKLDALVFGYGILLLGALARPLGALFFGSLGDKRGRNVALFWSLGIMALSSFAMALLPGVAVLGILSPILLLVIRMLQTMSAAGELNGAAIFLIESMESTEPTKTNNGLASGLAWAFTVLGMFGGAYASYMSTIDTWRYAFFIGGLIGFVAILMRFIPKKSVPKAKVAMSNESIIENVIAVILVAAGISGMFYYNMISVSGLLQCKLEPSVVQKFSMQCFLLYSVVLLISGRISDYLKRPEYMMLFASLVLAIIAVPIYRSGILYLHFINVIFLGIFVGPSHAILFTLFPPQYRYRGISIAYGIGTSVVGGLTPFCCSYFSKMTPMFPGYWSMSVSILAFVGVLLSWVVKHKQGLSR